MEEANSLRFAAPFTPSQTALRERPFRVGEWLVEPEAGHLHRAGHEPVTLEPEQILTLVLLADRAGSAVPDDTLLATIWPQAGGDTGSLHATVASLEQILDREPASDATFERADGGYRLRAPVRLLATESGSWRSARREPVESPEEPVETDRATSRALWPLAVTVAAAVILLLVLALR